MHEKIDDPKKKKKNAKKKGKKLKSHDGNGSYAVNVCLEASSNRF